MRIDYALRQHEQWYKGDGAYGDGPEFHWDYYNSFVIHPMLVDVLEVCGDETAAWKEIRTRVTQRARRYAAVQERLIAPDGSFPPIGRSIAYRCGAFHLLAQAALRRALPDGVSPGAGPRRADRRDPPDDRRARHVRRRRMAAHRLLRAPARHRRVVHLDRQPLSLRRRPPAARPAARRPVLGRRRRSPGPRRAPGQVNRSRSTTRCNSASGFQLPASDVRSPIPDLRIPALSYTNGMAVRRGVWVVIVLIVLAVSISAIGHAADLQRGRPRATGHQQFDARPAHRREPERDGSRRRVRPVHRRHADRPSRRRDDPQGQDRQAHHEHHPEAVRRGRAVGRRSRKCATRSPTSARSGKPIVAYLEYGGEQEFYLATVCDKVFLMPTTTLDLTGMASYELFLRGTLDKIGAYPDSLHIGEYKTASNTLTEHTYTPAHREMAESLNNDMYEQLVRGIADGRKKSEADVKTLIDHGPFLPEDALRAGLIDDLAYEDEIDDKVKLGSGKIHYVDMNDYRQVSAREPGPEPRTADRGHLRDRPDRLRQEHLRHDRRAGRGLGDARRVPAQGAGRQLGQGDRAARRQPGRLGASRPTSSGAKCC